MIITQVFRDQRVDRLLAKMGFLGFEMAFGRDRQVMAKRDRARDERKAPDNEKTVGKRKKAGVMTTPAFSFTRG